MPPPPKLWQRGCECTPPLGMGGARGGSLLSAPPPATLSLRGCKTRRSGQHRPRPPRPGSALGLLAPLTSLTRSCKPAAGRRGRGPRRGPGAETAGAYPAPRRGPRCDPPAAAAAHSKPAAASPAAPAAWGRRSPRPAETGGRWRGSGAARARFGLPRPSGGAGEGSAPPAVRGARQPVRRRRRPGPVDRRLCPAPSSRGEAPPGRLLEPDGRWPQAAPKFTEEGAMRRGKLWSSGSPGWRVRSAAEPLPFGLGGTPAARPRRASRRGKSPRREGWGKAAGGFRTR